MKLGPTPYYMFCRFFHQYPYFQQLYPKVRDLQSTSEMKHSLAFEIHAVAIFDIFDEIIINLEKDVDRIMFKLEEVVNIHCHIPGFSGDLFKVQRFVFSYINSLANAFPFLPLPYTGSCLFSYIYCTCIVAFLDFQKYAFS